MVFTHQFELGDFMAGPLSQQWRVACSGSQAVVDNPGPRSDPGAAQVGLQVGRFKDGSRFSQRDQDDLGAFLILELHHRCGVLDALVGVAHHVAVVGPGGVQQQQGVRLGRCP